MLQWEHWAFGETVLTIPSLATHFTMTPSIDHIKIQEVSMTNQDILFDLDGTLLPMDNDRFTKDTSISWPRQLHPMAMKKNRWFPPYGRA